MTGFLPLRATAWILLGTLLISSKATAEESPDKTHVNLKKELLSNAVNLSLIGDVYTGSLEHRRSVRIPILIEEPGCYRVTVVGEDSVEDISLVLYQSDEEKAHDRLSGKRPVVEWCAPEGGNVEAEVLMFSGTGKFVLATFAKKAGITPQKTKKIGGSDKDFIANRIRQLHTHFGKGRPAVSEVLRGNLSQDGEQTFPIKVTGKCISIIVAQDPSLLQLDISVSNASGNLPTSKRNTASFALAETEPCPQKGGEYRVAVRAVQGAGRFGLQVFSE